MASKELKPMFSPTFKVVDNQELRVDVFLPNRDPPSNEVKCPIGEYFVALLPRTCHCG